MSNNSSNFDGTTPLGWSLLKASIASESFVNGLKTEQNSQTLIARISRKTLNSYENRYHTVQADYETFVQTL